MGAASGKVIHRCGEDRIGEKNELRGWKKALFNKAVYMVVAGGRHPDMGVGEKNEIDTISEVLPSFCDLSTDFQHLSTKEYICTRVPTPRYGKGK
jgi:hypothetical protein